MTGPRFRLVEDPFPEGEYQWFQLAFVVDDLEASARMWADLYGIGPFYVLPPTGRRAARYRGAPSEIDYQIAVSQAGPVQIELVHQRCDNPSVFRDVHHASTRGVHHIATMTDDFDATLAHYAERGHEPVTELDTGNGRVAFIDTMEAVGLMTEVRGDIDNRSADHR